MICKKCGNVVNGEKYCPYCGEKVEQEKREDIEIKFNHVETKNRGPRGDNFRLPQDRLKQSITGLALAITALILCFFPFVGLILSIPAFIVSIIGASSLRMRGFGIAGAIISPFAFLLGILYTCLIVGSLGSFNSNSKREKAERKAQSVFNAAKIVLLEASVTGKTTYEGITVSDDTEIYYITVKDLLYLGEIESNPFKTSYNDGGMTIYYDTSDGAYSCSASGTIDGYNIRYMGSYYGFYAYKD